MPEKSSAEHDFVEVGRYARLAEARERALVMSARELPHRIDHEGDAWVLRIEPAGIEIAARELASFEAEQRELPAPAAELPPEPFRPFSLYVAAWLSAGLFLAQNLANPAWTDRGEADSTALLRGEWWRAITALTLHGDLAHLLANLATGLLFAGFLLARLGTGVTWLAIVLSGALGNVINAWGYRGQVHHSIGASTAVFGALGILVSLEVVARISSPHTRNRWQLIVPFGAGFALLAFLGAADEQRRVDYMAHWWGFVAGLLLGALAAALRVKARTSPAGQRVVAAAAGLLIAAAWWAAMR